MKGNQRKVNRKHFLPFTCNTRTVRIRAYPTGSCLNEAEKKFRSKCSQHDSNPLKLINRLSTVQAEARRRSRQKHPSKEHHSVANKPRAWDAGIHSSLHKNLEFTWLQYFILLQSSWAINTTCPDAVFIDGIYGFNTQNYLAGWMIWWIYTGLDRK